MDALRGFPKKECINTEISLRREWLDTNGIGGYASSTVLDCHTRKYHGLLVADLERPKGRFVLLSKVEASLVAEGKEFFLSTNKYPGVFHPTGHQFMESFTQGLWPQTEYAIGDVLIRRTAMCVQGENTVILSYELAGGKVRPTLRLRPMLAYRSAHELTFENMSLRAKCYPQEGGCKIDPYEGMPPLFMSINRDHYFHPGPKWFKNLEYHKERRRGFDYQDDSFSPGVFEVELAPGKPVLFAASLDPLGDIGRKRRAEIARREKAFAACTSSSRHLRWLKWASGQFLVRRPGGRTGVIAGYPWFGEWGRDTMISLPGVAFHSGRHKMGEKVLAGYAKLVKDGLIPNFIGDRDGEAAYNSVDASLWMFWTVQQYLMGPHDKNFVAKTVYPALREVVAAHLDGRVPRCGIDADGLLHAGGPDTQLTWMDAQAWGRPVTPRHGAAVELNALFYNALRFFVFLAKAADAGLAGRAEQAADKMAASFERRFFNPETGCLFDVVREHDADGAIRPNQIFAVSLPHSMLSLDRMHGVVREVQAHLLTPYGLRTLSPTDQQYAPVYEGGPDERDAAYHQGTVWPWLSCHFAEALLRQAEDAKGARAFLRKHFAPLLRRFPDNYGVASLPEIYDANPPHAPQGCIAQAWSVAEALRLARLLGSK